MPESSITTRLGQKHSRRRDLLVNCTSVAQLLAQDLPPPPGAIGRRKKRNKQRHGGATSLTGARIILGLQSLGCAATLSECARLGSVRGAGKVATVVTALLELSDLGLIDVLDGDFFKLSENGRRHKP